MIKLTTCALACLLPLAAVAEEFTETTVMFTTFGKATGLPLPRNGADGAEASVAEMCNLPEDPLINSAASGELVGMVLDVVFTEFRRAAEARQDRQTRTYAANKNIPAFTIPRDQARCVSLARLRIDADQRIIGFVSLAIFALVRDTETAFAVRPLYLKTPVLDTLTPGDEPNAAAAISLKFNVVTPTLTEQSFVREFSVPEHHAGNGARPHVFARIPGGGLFADFEDSAYLPYYADQPVSIAVAVTETAAKNPGAGAIARLFTMNGSALSDRIKRVLGGR